MADDFDQKTYDDIAKTIPDVGFGTEMDLGKGAASVGDSAFDPSTMDFSNLDQSTTDWSGFAADLVKTAATTGASIAKTVIETEAGKRSSAGPTIPAVQGSGSVTSRTNFPSINLPVPDVKPAAPPAVQPAVAKDNTALYVGLGLGAAALTVGVAVALSRRSRKRRAI